MNIEKFVEKYVTQFRDFTSILKEREAELKRNHDENVRINSEYDSQVDFVETQNEILGALGQNVTPEETAASTQNGRDRVNSAREEATRESREGIANVKNTVLESARNQISEINQRIEFMNEQLQAYRADIARLRDQINRFPVLRADIEEQLEPLTKASQLMEKAIGSMNDYLKLLNNVAFEYSKDADFNYDMSFTDSNELTEMNKVVNDIDDIVNGFDYSELVVDVVFDPETELYNVNCTFGKYRANGIPPFTREQLTSQALDGILAKFAKIVGDSSATYSRDEVMKMDVQCRVNGNNVDKTDFYNASNVITNNLDNDLTVEPVVEDVPVNPVVEEAPVNPTVEETPVNPVVEDVPVNPTVEETPVEPTVEETPVNPTVEDVPVNPTVEETPVEPTVEETPVEPEIEEAAMTIDEIRAEMGSILGIEPYVGIENEYEHAIGYQLDDYEKDRFQELRDMLNDIENGVRREPVRVTRADEIREEMGRILGIAPYIGIENEYEHAIGYQLDDNEKDRFQELREELEQLKAEGRDIPGVVTSTTPSDVTPTNANGNNDGNNAGGGTGDDTPTDDQNNDLTDNQPTGDDLTDNQPTGDDLTDNQPTGDDLTDNQPTNNDPVNGPGAPAPHHDAYDRQALRDVMYQAVAARSCRRDKFSRITRRQYLLGAAALGLGFVGVPVASLVGAGLLVAGVVTHAADFIDEHKDQFRYNAISRAYDRIARQVTDDYRRDNENSRVSFRVEPNPETREIRFVMYDNEERIGVVDSNTTGTIGLSDGEHMDLVTRFNNLLNESFDEVNDDELRRGSYYEQYGIPKITVDTLEAMYTEFGGFDFGNEYYQFNRMDHQRPRRGIRSLFRRLTGQEQPQLTDTNDQRLTDRVDATIDAFEDGADRFAEPTDDQIQMVDDYTDMIDQLDNDPQNAQDNNAQDNVPTQDTDPAQPIVDDQGANEPQTITDDEINELRATLVANLGQMENLVNLDPADIQTLADRIVGLDSDYSNEVIIEMVNNPSITYDELERFINDRYQNQNNGLDNGQGPTM